MLRGWPAGGRMMVIVGISVVVAAVAVEAWAVVARPVAERWDPRQVAESIGRVLSAATVAATLVALGMAAREGVKRDEDSADAHALMTVQASASRELARVAAAAHEADERARAKREERQCAEAMWTAGDFLGLLTGLPPLNHGDEGPVVAPYELHLTLQSFLPELRRVVGGDALPAVGRFKLAQFHHALSIAADHGTQHWLDTKHYSAQCNKCQATYGLLQDAARRGAEAVAALEARLPPEVSRHAPWGPLVTNRGANRPTETSVGGA